LHLYIPVMCAGEVSKRAELQSDNLVSGHF